MNAKDTKTAILDAAELLFSKQGFAATSVREITRAAGVHVAAVHYHFGRKEDVLRGVTDRIVGPLNQRRMDLLDAVLRHADPAPIGDILDSFIRPDIETLQDLQKRGPTVAHFMGRIYGDQTPWIQQMALEQFKPSRERFFPAAAESLGLSLEEVAWRFTRVVALVVHLFATWPEEGRTDDQAEATIRRFVGLPRRGHDRRHREGRERSTNRLTPFPRHSRRPALTRARPRPRIQPQPRTGTPDTAMRRVATRGE